MTMGDMIVCFASVIGAFMIGWAGGRDATRWEIQEDAIKNGVARYHPETGEFEWKGKEDAEHAAIECE